MSKPSHKEGSQRPLFESSEDPQDPIVAAAMDSADRLAAELLYRIENLSEREKLVRRDAAWDTLSNMPARLIWESLEPGAAAFFVVYKLMHEARSNLPKIYRAIAWRICSAQPERFGLVTYREQLWSVLASVDYWPEDLEGLSEGRLAGFIRDELSARSKTDWLSRRTEDIQRDAQWIANRLLKDGKLLTGMRTLQRLQLAKQSALTAGNIILQIPRKLETLADTFVSQAKEGELPTHGDLLGRIASLAAKYSGSTNLGISSNASVPFDLITLDEDQRLRIIAMTRHKASRAEQEDLRRRMVYLRFFAHYAFGERKPEDIEVVAAFYADKDESHDKWFGQKPMFNSEELWSFETFWDYVAGRKGGAEIVERVTTKAAAGLKDKDVVAKLRLFVSTERKPAGQLF